LVKKISNTNNYQRDESNMTVQKNTFDC